MRKYYWAIAVAAAVPFALMGVDLWMWQSERSALAMEATTSEPSILVAPAWSGATSSEGPVYKRSEEQWDDDLTLPSRNVSLAQ